MLYYSTQNPSHRVSFREAAIEGQAPDKGLYFPETIPTLPDGFIEKIETLSKEEIALQVITPFVGESIPHDVLKKIVARTVDFDFPLVPVSAGMYALELFHGPTLAFKDVGARFMSQCLGYFMEGETKKVTVLVATSGDTGGAVANGFYAVEGVDVVILYPSGKVSNLQELQLTTLGKNITALEIDGTFDDCQRMVKASFSDKVLNETLFLTSANSINVARWLPQQFYYFFAYQQWKRKDKLPVISVPSGNFGNICAGLMAYRTGLPVQHFIAACNANDSVPEYLQSGNYLAKPAIATLSNAMDVGDPSNFVRMMRLFNDDLHTIKDMVSGYSISDETTKQTIRDVYETYNYLLDPHGAVGYNALQQYLQHHPGQEGFFLETAHPVKFYDVVEVVINGDVPIPKSVEGLFSKKKKSIRMKASSDALKTFLIDHAATPVG
jgi:threonine synthase